MSEDKKMSGNDQAGYHGDKRLTLLSLFKEEDLEKLLWQLASATDLAVALADYRGDECTDCINYAQFCRYARENDICRVSNATNAFGITQAAVTGKPFVYFCPFGLLMFAIPIIIDGDYLGGFIGGQVRCLDAPEDTVHLKNVLPYKKDFLEDEESRKLFYEAKEISYKKYINVAALMESYIRQLTEKKKDRVSYELIKKAEKAYKEEHLKRLKAENISRRYRMISLKSQLKPYFIMSTLTAISNLAMIENAVQTNELITRFARFMTDLFQRNMDIQSIGDEVRMIEAYLSIYKSWMGDRLEYRVLAAGKIRNQAVPAMLLFVLVEQAVLSVVINSKKNGSICIEAGYDGDQVLVTVSDNRSYKKGDDSSQLLLEQIEGMQGGSARQGMEFVIERMKDYFHDDYVLNKEVSEEGETIITLKYPRHFEKEMI